MSRVRVFVFCSACILCYFPAHSLACNWRQYDWCDGSDRGAAWRSTAGGIRSCVERQSSVSTLAEGVSDSFIEQPGFTWKTTTSGSVHLAAPRRMHYFMSRHVYRRQKTFDLPGSGSALGFSPQGSFFPGYSRLASSGRPVAPFLIVRNTFETSLDVIEYKYNLIDWLGCLNANNIFIFFC